MSWIDVFRHITPKGNAKILAGMADTMPAIITKASLITPLRRQHFLAQSAEESDGFVAWHEYASGARYNGRRDLGNIHPGDGPRYRGAGCIELTGRLNYRKVGKELGLDLEGNPLLVQSFPTWGLVGAVYWREHNINDAADRNDIEACTRLVNGGLNGLAKREIYFARARYAVKMLL